MPSSSSPLPLAIEQVADDRIAAVRAFNRFYTRKLGVLDQHLGKSPFSLSEARVLYELAHRDELAAKEIGIELGLDPGYLSRIVQSFDEKGLITRRPLPADRRQYQLSLTAKGRQTYAKLNLSSQNEVAAMLAQLSASDATRLTQAMATIEALLEQRRTQPAAFMLRSHRVGDMGWVISKQAAAYAADYNWDISYEALVAEICAQFIKNYDAAREHCWIAEVGGEPVGSIFLVKATDEIAKLRLLQVEKKARGLGVGRALVEQCLQGARERGYGKMTLWTQSILVAARGIYQSAGFKLVKQEKHHSFGADLVGETWERDL
ncbi:MULTISPECIES: bifunctional helix-turn-helix transcriptional regulator/GNAT family N-acetyltransferase [Bradyrhizobium]|uniref:DNA-binding MarR family transcriptional regulator/GNAT superfamily N-acetyltransferase n=1 Tax=Bradyrhizobium ottawaense TaxID=931866 RepID=A0ABV4FX56_9BRAD|nr:MULTISPECIES: helix-turn-helix domain-containing GNAT family N-acetyltransferase [Bradyrhizobium]MBR1291782.1 MarR family transcriptional regulator [Bradyrhizobium ottawaense]MDA9418701.1 MarR family transcriptional regulator [Bradyrhizobium sp. CCBAU 25360]MDA9445300.1 MarR family transcriptional regulator [Bradyrhizobium sp. CCBAU 21360]MDA9453289.1 MarR family transcriptional regulator [Bradyrhizobium sp. CCBAU 21359]MDA9486222.1 MarR family transcriptional regulator [Bradyrhizobium sp. 